MDSIYDRFENLSFDAGPTQYEERKLIKSLNPDIIPKIENIFEDYEKVSLSFLFFDDVNTCLNICEKCVNNRNYNFMSENAFQNYSNWDEKFVECAFYVQHILLLKKLGIGLYEAEIAFKNSKFVSKQRLLLYKICENLSKAETSHLMKAMPSLSPEKYLEIFILKILLSNNGLKHFILLLSSLNIPVINSFLEEINGYSCVDNNVEVNHVSELCPKSKHVSIDDIYPIKDPKNVGLCFIINEVNFKKELRREGSSEDVAILQSTMEYFNIDVKVFDDVPKTFFDHLDTNINIHFEEKNYSVFFMVIMSHGIPGAIYSSDEKPVFINNITLKLSCKSLHKIPKVLIIQACQGQMLLLEDIATDGPNSLEFDQAPEFRYKFGSHISDFLIAMSTVNGFKSFRDKIKGSWFIQALCKCMKDYENECILSIITKTIREVKNNSLPLARQCTQQPEFRSLFEKKLYLKPVINNYRYDE